MREKTRYLKVEIDGVECDEATARRLVNEALFSWLGERKAAEARTRFVEWTPPHAIVRCNNAVLTDVVAALALKRFFHENSVALRIERVSGTLAALRGRTKREKPS